jgi:dTDP-glucose pyrophosphorylase
MKNLTIQSDGSIKDSLKKLSMTGEKCLIVTDKDSKLLGTLSDGDLRKAILSGAVLSDTIEGIYQLKPTVLIDGNYKIDNARELFIKYRFDLIPIVNQNSVVVDVLTWAKVFKNGKKDVRQALDVPVVIMAGGRGARLEPFTKVLPKPLVPIHDKPIIEHIIERFTELGCSNFYLTVNYKGKLLKAYFDELQPNYKVQFVEEQEPLGTAGSLQYLHGHFDQPFFVTNCDIIIKVDYANLYEFHQKGSYDITLVASAKQYVFPYGTCELNGDGHLSHIKEKPRYDFLVNTGLYVLNPSVLDLIPKNKFCHITHLIEDVRKQGKKVGVFPIDDDTWIDVGQWEEYKKSLEEIENM